MYNMKLSWRLRDAAAAGPMQAIAFGARLLFHSARGAGQGTDMRKHSKHSRCVEVSGATGCIFLRAW